jgi:hypothetical protein
MKQLFFFFVGIVQMFRPANWSVVKIETFVTDTKTRVINYFYNGKLHKFVGETLPNSIPRGFFAPIKAALWNGVDVTDRVKSFAGPRHDFYGAVPDLAMIFHKVSRVVWIPKIEYNFTNGFLLKISWEKETVIEPAEGVLEVQNILNQTSVFGAKKNLSSPKLATE